MKTDPNRPDPQRVEAWRVSLREAATEVQGLVHARANYERFAALVRSNDHVLHGESDFPTHVQRWFVHFAAMAIRRIVEPNDSGDIVSLRSVLDEMIRAARAFTSKEISDLFDAPDGLSRYEEAFSQFLISDMWSEFGDPTSPQEQLNARMIKNDRRMLDAVSREITDMVDKRIAHHTTRKDDYDLFYAELSACIDVIEAISLRYYRSLMGASQSTFVPTDQFNWLDIFAEDWLYGKVSL